MRAKLNSWRARVTVPVRVFVVGVVVSLVAAIVLHRDQERRAEQRITAAASDLEARMRARVDAYIALLRGAIGLFAAQPELSREEFRRYVAQLDIEDNYPGIQGIGVSVRVPKDEVAAFERRVRAAGAPSFRIWPDHAREDYHAILYLEPQDMRNRAALGYDMFSEPARREAMQHAALSGRAAATGRVTLVQEIDADKQAGFLVYVPYYAGGTWPRTEEERLARLRGFVYAPFRVGDLMRAISRGLALDGIGYAIYDRDTVDEAARLSQSIPPELAGAGRVVTRTRRIRVFDRDWSIVFTGAPRGLLPPLGLFLIGLAGSATFALVLRREGRERQRAVRSEEETREREGELSLLIEAVPAVVTFIDRDGNFRLANRRYQEWFGADARAILGRSLREVLGPKLYADLDPFVQRALRGESVSYERWQRLGRAGEHYLSTYLVPHRGRSGELHGFYSLTSDLTSLKRAEEAARFLADCGKLLVSSLDYEAGARGIVHLAVPRVADMALVLRVEEGELVPAAVAHTDDAVERSLGEYLRSMRLSLDGSHNIALAARSGMVVVTTEVTADDLARISAAPEDQALLRRLQIASALHVPVVVRGRIWAVFSFGATAATGRRFTDQHRALAEEVSTRMRLAVENALLHAEAKQEIEERRRAERTMAETEERFRLLVAGARDYAIILLHPDGAIATWNEGAQRILGYSEGDALGLPISRLYLKEEQSRGAPRDELARARNDGSALEERWYVRKDGTRFWASGHTVALRTDAGLLRGYAKILRDLTERKLTEDELEQRVRQRTLELNEAVQELEAFSYSVSHDLRAPLRSIRGFTELAIEEGRGRLSESELGYLDRVQRAAARLDQLISDLLAYTRISKTRVELVRVELHALVHDILREHPELQAPHALVRVTGDLLPVVGNVAYLTQCLTNLMSNAVKFVRPGEQPEVRIWTEARGGAVRLFVRDNGIGIPRESYARVFEMFERLHAGSVYEGTGVGLAIVRRAVQRMNGTIGVESEEGKGTEFWIELPGANHG